MIVAPHFLSIDPVLAPVLIGGSWKELHAVPTLQSGGGAGVCPSGTVHTTLLVIMAAAAWPLRCGRSGTGPDVAGIRQDRQLIPGSRGRRRGHNSSAVRHRAMFTDWKSAPGRNPLCSGVDITRLRGQEVACPFLDVPVGLLAGDLECVDQYQWLGHGSSASIDRVPAEVTEQGGGLADRASASGHSLSTGTQSVACQQDMWHCSGWRRMLASPSSTQVGARVIVVIKFQALEASSMLTFRFSGRADAQLRRGCARVRAVDGGPGRCRLPVSASRLAR